MKRRSLTITLAALLLTVLSGTALAALGNDEDTATRMVNAKVVEVNDEHISVMAQTGVEHVIAIAIDNTNTKVKLEGKLVSLKALREGDVVSVELDTLNPLKFAKNISVSLRADSQLATIKP